MLRTQETTLEEHRPMLAPAPGAGRRNPILAYSIPFALFLLFGVVESWQPLSQYYPWIYSLKIALVATAWWRLRAPYPRPSRTGMGLGVLVGVVGVVVWIVLANLNLESVLPDWLLLGQRVSYNPLEAIATPLGQ